MKTESRFYVCKGEKKIEPFEFDYNIKEFKVATLKKVVKNNG